jgi:hypothetical protein
MEGVQTLDVSNSTGGELTVASTFSSSSTARRALSTKGGYDIQDKISFVTFSIDASTTTGNVVELWMYASGKYIQSALSIVPGSMATYLTVRYSGGNAVPQQQPVACAFAKQVSYQLKLSIYKETGWNVKAELTVGSSSLCTALLVATVPNSFFSEAFTYVISQSGTGTTVQRVVKAADESISIKVSKMGVECVKGTCASVAPSNTVQKYSSSGTNTGIVAAAVIAFVGGFVVLSVIIVVILVAVAIKRRRSRKTNVYLDSAQEMDVRYDEEEHIQEEQQPTMYDAFAPDTTKLK